jgi:hypothetical protein
MYLTLNILDNLSKFIGLEEKKPLILELLQSEQTLKQLNLMTNFK